MAMNPHPDVDKLDLTKWWQPDELSNCPECGQRSVAPVGASGVVRICVACGWSEDTGGSGESSQTAPRPFA
jgi:hypothetical protein